MARGRSGRLIAVAAAAVAAVKLAPGFVSAPQASQEAFSTEQAMRFSPAVAMSAAMPVLTMLADDAEAKLGDSRRWSAVLVPLTTLVLPAVAFGSFVLYSFQEDAFWRLVPGTKRGLEAEAAWREHPLFANSRDPMEGLINPDDYEKGLEDAWEKAKPAGSTITVKEKLKELGTQNNPHFEQWKKISA
ncbi:unnamed protein product [Polarella glacialis]|uniref:Photosystem I reaction center subunit VIII n=3 Tax=Polarella glacialis TaxID=89957 RepID=A0A813HTL8_POLGL|nr:unnamed protein product [Polarella glacialis]|eukprot:CAMPEP_0115074478 /NCGR_PEP_ID=MMETSP0227-20121206/15358_1 /TAXON_ID=89957 /ORGANISM="Polarella glacialis, Strain CCMP 1383" /LENGTH=187 /DNA_ID=CAMNT_0002461441 /DNA_START=75 /DNA_END=638 /DNA_ORIENTATION=+